MEGHRWRFVRELRAMTARKIPIADRVIESIG